MKRKFIIILAFIACMLLTSCCEPGDYSGYNSKPVTNEETKPLEKKNEWQPYKKEYFTKVSESSRYFVIRHNATGILYIINIQGGAVMVVNPDGTPYVQN
jgi:hypothetical protein